MRGAGSDRGIVTVVVVDLGHRRIAGAEPLGAPATWGDRSTVETIVDMATGHGGWVLDVPGQRDRPVVAFVDPRAAVSFALALRGTQPESRSTMRVGADAGELSSTDDSRSATLIEIASSIARCAAPGEVLVSDVVRQLVAAAPAVEFAEHGTYRLAGDRRRLWRAVSGPSPVQVDGTIGMIAELESLDQALGRLASGTGGLLVVEGRPGEGKTHLATEAASRAVALGVEVVSYTADELVRRPGGLTHALVASATGATATPWRRRLEDLVDDAAAGRVDDDLTYAIVDASVDLVDVVAGSRPLLIVVEDLHWADALTMAVVAALARRASISRFLLLASSRPAPRPRGLDRVIDIADEQPGRLVRLQPMSEADVVAFAASLLGAAPGEELRRRLAAANGNPLIVKELVRCLEDDGAIRIRSGVAHVDGVGAPTGLHDALVRRLSWLSPETNDTLRLASLFGKSFTLRDVASISGRTVVEVAIQLRDAARSGFLSGSGERLSFTHDLVRDAIYADMVPAARRELHRAAALALIDTGAPLTQIAQQFAIGATVGDLEAIGWLERAADEIFSVSPSTGIDLIGRALQLAPLGWARRGELQAKLLDPLVWCGRLDESEATAQAVLDTAPSPAAAFLAWRGLAGVHGNRGAALEAVAALERALAVPDAPADECARLRCMLALQTVFAGATPVAEATSVCEAQLRAVDESDRGSATTRATIHQTLGLLLAMAGNVAASCTQLAAAGQLVASGAATSNSYLVPDVYRSLSLGEVDPAAAAELADDLCRRRGRDAASVAMPLAHMASGRAHLAMGDIDRAESELDAGLTIIDEEGGRFAFLLLVALRARVAVRRGDRLRARVLLGRGIDHVNTHGAVLGTDWLFGVHAELLAIEGDTAGAFAVADAVWNQMSPIRLFYGYQDLGITLTRLAASQQQPELAATVSSEMNEGARRHDTIAARAAASWCAGLAVDDPDQLAAAIELYRDTPLQIHFADCCADTAAAEARRGRTARAITLLEEALAAADACGCAGDVQRYTHHLAQLGVPRRARTRPTHGWDALTPAELVVCGHVADGLTNVEIGQRLFISRRTVESHLAHVYTKLGYSSRTQLATECVRRQTPQ